VVPLVVDPDELDWIPLELDDFWLLVSVEVDDGTAGVTDWVVVELEDELCANAAPVIMDATIVAANRVLIICNTPRALSRTGIARFAPDNLALARQ
jgi:hypothetical protein